MNKICEYFKYLMFLWMSPAVLQPFKSWTPHGRPASHLFKSAFLSVNFSTLFATIQEVNSDKATETRNIIFVSVANNTSWLVSYWLVR